jgi:tRNA-Thr(GGU) m(6)t(6)A37 methyltransferase TsaA
MATRQPWQEKSFHSAIEQEEISRIQALSFRENVLRENAKQLGFTGNFLNDVLRDGHCVYHAILHQLFNNFDLYQIVVSNRFFDDDIISVRVLRTMVMSYLQRNCQKFSAELEDLSTKGVDTELLAVYLQSLCENQEPTHEIEEQLGPIFERMAKSSDWGGILQIRILAKIFALNAIIVTSNEYYVLQSSNASGKAICLAFDRGDTESAAHYYSLIDSSVRLLPGDITRFIGSADVSFNDKPIIRESLSILPDIFLALPSSSSLLKGKVGSGEDRAKIECKDRIGNESIDNESFLATTSSKSIVFCEARSFSAKSDILEQRQDKLKLDRREIKGGKQAQLCSGLGEGKSAFFVTQLISKSEVIMKFNAIGIIHTPFKELNNMPIQPAGAKDIEGEIIINPEYAEGLSDLEGFSHIYLIYYFHKAPNFKLKVRPFMDTKEHGIFATRAPLRPSPIGLSIVKLIGRKGNRLQIKGIDVLDGTPLIDIKPYVPHFDHQDNATCGWMVKSKKEVEDKRSDDRFFSLRAKL